MIIVEYISKGYKHADVNAATIALYIKKNPEEKIHLFCDIVYFETIQTILKNNSINCKNLINHPITSFAKQVRDYKMILFDFKVVSDIFKWAKENHETNILFLYTSTFMLYYTKLFCWLNKGINVNSIIHGDLERIDLIGYAKSFTKGMFLQFLYALFFGLRIPLTIPTPKNLKYIVLSENIKNNAIKIIPSLKNNLVAIPLPYFYEQIEEHSPFLNNKIHFCIPGLSAARKNIPILKKLTDTIDNNFDLKNKINIAFGGLIMDNSFYEEMLEKSFVDKSTVSMSMLPPEVRDNSLINADYALMTYQLDSYKLIASAAFLDAVNMETPLFAIRNNFIQYYFNKYGNIGYMFDSYEELENKLKDIVQNTPVEEYKEQVNNIKKIKEQEAIDTTVKILKENKM